MGNETPDWIKEKLKVTHKQGNKHLFLWWPQAVEFNEDLHLSINKTGPPASQTHLQSVAAPHTEHMIAALITPKIYNLEVGRRQCW